jgi:integrase
MKRAKRITPVGVRDAHGAKAEDALKELLKELQGVRSAAREAGSALLRDVLASEVEQMSKDTVNYSRKTVDSYVRVEKILNGSHERCTDRRRCKSLEDLRANEVTVATLKAILKAIAEVHGRTTAKQARTLLVKVGEYLVEADAWSHNLAESVKLPKGSESKPAQSFIPVEARELLTRMQTSEDVLKPSYSGKRDTGRTVSKFAASVDLVDPVAFALYTGLRRSELLGVLWSDIDLKAGTLTVNHHLVRAYKADGSGTELVHEAATKTKTSARVIALPDDAIELLKRRRGEFMRPGGRVLAKVDSQGRKVPNVVFPNTVGQLRDPDTFSGQWRRVREALCVDFDIDASRVGMHVMRKTTASILKKAGKTSVQIADVLGHKQVSTTENIYFGRDRQHPDAAAALNEALSTDVGS